MIHARQTWRYAQQIRPLALSRTKEGTAIPKIAPKNDPAEVRNRYANDAAVKLPRSPKINTTELWARRHARPDTTMAECYDRKPEHTSKRFPRAPPFRFGFLGHHPAHLRLSARTTDAATPVGAQYASCSRRVRVPVGLPVCGAAATERPLHTVPLVLR